VKFLPLNVVSETLERPHVKPDVVLGTYFPPECSDWHISGSRQMAGTYPSGGTLGQGGSTGTGPSVSLLFGSHIGSEEELSPMRRDWPRCGDGSVYWKALGGKHVGLAPMRRRLVAPKVVGQLSEGSVPMRKTAHVSPGCCVNRIGDWLPYGGGSP